MKHITFYLDFVSPYACLAFARLPQALEGLGYAVRYRPVLLGALLRHHGQRAPAELASKRAWVYRQTLWLAHAHGIALQLPAAHPFNPLPLLRMALACAGDGTCNRYVAGQLMAHVWEGGADALEPARLQALAARLPPPRLHADSAEVKQLLRANTDEAAARGVFGVPTLAVDDHLFWGQDALPMLRAYLQGDAWFDGPAWEAAQALPSGLP